MAALTKGLTWPFLLLALLTTFVYMAGLAALQRSCYSGGFPGINGGTFPNSTPTSAFGMSDGWGNCSKVFRFYWFTFAFVIVTLLSVLIAAITHLGLHHARPFFTGMITISIILMMIASEAFTGFHDAYKYGGIPAGGSWMSRIRTVLAGAIMSVIALILLLLAVGTDWERHGTRGHRSRDDKVTGTHTTTTTNVAVPVENVRVVDQV